MTTIQAANHVIENGCSLLRLRKDELHQWDVKPMLTGKRRGWFYMDAFTASMLVTVYNALSNDEAKAKFNRIPLMRLIDFGWKHIKAA